MIQQGIVSVTHFGGQKLMKISVYKTIFLYVRGRDKKKLAYNS